MNNVNQARSTCLPKHIPATVCKSEKKISTLRKEKHIFGVNLSADFFVSVTVALPIFQRGVMDNKARESAWNKRCICLKLQAAAGLGSNEFVDGNS